MSIAPEISNDRTDYQAEYYAKKQGEKHEIGPVPKCKYPKIREKCFDSLLYYLRELFAEEPFFTDPFGPVQISSIRHEEAVLRGKAGNINKLEPRGYGKTSRSLIGANWACKTGVQDFVMLCGDSADKSADMMRMAHLVVCENPMVRDVFPEVYAFHALNLNPHACRYQLFEGNPTKISIKGDTLYYPKLNGKYPCEEAMIVTRPYKKARGKNIEGRRPTVVILDDIQSSEEAASPTSVRKNVKTLTSDIAYLGTRKNPVTIINNATIIEDDDYPSKVAEMEAFTTVRYKMVDNFPDGCEPKSGKYSDDWARYFEIRSEYDADIVGDKERAWIAARNFYTERRESMDAGSSVTWDYAFSEEKKKEISTIQAAMNFIKDFGWESFRSECQNEALAVGSDIGLLTAKEIAAKQHPYGLLVVPPWCDLLTAYVDVQKDVLFFKIWGFQKDGFTGGNLKFGTFPEQKDRYFTKKTLKVTLADVYETTTLEARQKQALLDLTDDLCQHEFEREDGLKMQIEIVGIDSRYQTGVVRDAYRESKNKGRLQLCMGTGYGAKKKPQRHKVIKKRSGAAKGFGWFLNPSVQGIQTLEMDTNRLKSFVHQRYSTELGDPGSFSLYEADPLEHELNADHETAEFFTRLEGPYGLVDEWEVKPGRPDNDGFDCTVGCVAVASLKGAKMVGAEEREDGRVKRKVVDGSKWGKKR